MLLIDALNQIIDDGIEAARLDYAHPKDKQKLDGSIRGFEECRGKAPAGIAELLVAANNDSQDRFNSRADDYWYWRCRTLEIEWVANVFSAILEANGHQSIVPITAHGVRKAAEIIGVAHA